MRLIHFALPLLTAATSPASAAILINQTAAGLSFTVDYDGSIIVLPTDKVSSQATFTYTGASADGRVYNFNYALANTSALTSQVRSFGFDTIGSNPTSTSVSGAYTVPQQNVLSSLLGSDICFSANATGTCNVGTGGVARGQTGTGSFALTFANMMPSLTLDNFEVRYQGISGLYAGAGVGTAGAVTTPTVVSVAPEPESWMMMIGGFGLLGWRLRRRNARRRAEISIA